MLTLDNCSVNFPSLSCRGQYYSETQPLERRLVPVFAENCAAKMTRYTTRPTPPTAVPTLCWQTILGGQFGPTVIITLSVLGLSVQGLWWLGKCSVTPLPPVIFSWFYEVRDKLQESGQALALVEGKPGYQVLVDAFKCAFKQLDKTFLGDL